MQRRFSDEHPLWLFLSEPGIGRLLTLELKHRDIIRQKARPELLMMRNSDVLVLPSSQVQNGKAESRLALESLSCPVFGRHRIGAAQLDHLAASWKKVAPSELTSSVAGSVFRRDDVMRLVQRGLRERGAELSGPSGNPPARLLIVDDRFYFAFSRFNHHDAKGRRFDQERHGALPPTIAAAMCFAAKLGEPEVIWDPVVGSGTLLAEAHAMVPGAAFIGSDVDESAIDAAKARLRRTGAKLVLGDSRTLNLDRKDLSLTLANLPFGKQFASGNAEDLYEALLRNQLEHAAPAWRAVLLTSNEAAIRRAVKSIGDLSISAVTKLRIRGHEATMWLVTRKT